MFEKGLGFGFDMGFGFGLEMGFGFEAFEFRPTVGSLGLKGSVGFGLEGWLSGESTSVTLEQLISHVPRGPRISLK